MKDGVWQFYNETKLLHSQLVSTRVVCAFETFTLQFITSPTVLVHIYLVWVCNRLGVRTVHIRDQVGHGSMEREPSLHIAANKCYCIWEKKGSF